MANRVSLFVHELAWLLLPLPLFLIAAVTLVFLHGGMPGVGGTDG